MTGLSIRSGHKKVVVINDMVVLEEVVVRRGSTLVRSLNASPKRRKNTEGMYSSKDY